MSQDLTRKVLIRMTGATINQISYLRDMERLPIERETTGAGRPIVYKQEAIQIVLAHMGKGSI